MRILAVLHTYRRDDPRSESRRPVALNASFERFGAAGIGCLVSNISRTGFMGRIYEEVTPGAEIFLRIPRFAAIPARVVWAQGGQVGCEFDYPLEPDLIDAIVSDAPQLQ